ncbi:MAG: hypothetical protein KBT29_08070 [Prevotellaceae bacterium]|nr:hypothetical protein [Candidatus Minthosoma caballi]
MTLDILICTIDDGIKKVPDVLIPQKSGVSYVVSMQYTDEKFKQMIPAELLQREDVTIHSIEGRGLSLNRNNALAHSSADIRLIADDDNRYTEAYIDAIFSSYNAHKEADIICFKAIGYDGKEMKKYPAEAMSYADACNEGYYPTSMEISFKKSVCTNFDIRFGLGSEKLCSGEEDVFLFDAIKDGYKAIFIPEVVVSSNPLTTGDKFLQDRKVQISKGATFKHIFGTRNALWRTVKEAGWHLVHNSANPFPIMYNMCKGIFLF